MDSQVLIQSLTAVTKKWTRQRKQEEKDGRASQRRRDAMIQSHRITIREAAFMVIEEAYMKASGGGSLPAHPRQIMYAARGQVQALTGRQLDDQYFTQGLLPEYMDLYSHKTADWDVVFDARGHFTEPHTNREVALGTLAVRDYLAGNHGSAYLADSDDLIHLYPTQGSRHRFGAILFIEKEGFLPLLQKVQIAERYDIAIMSTKGMSSTAARSLVDAMCIAGQKGVPLLIVRDFDKAGFSIAATLQNDTRRYQFRNQLKVHDFGLRLIDVKKWDLESETVSYGNSDPEDNLRDNGATDEEIAFLIGDGFTGKRVELNAFPSDAFIEWLKGKLDEHGIQKVLPDDQTLDDAYRRALKRAKVQELLAREGERIDEEVAAAVLPEHLSEQINDKLEEDPSQPWDMALTLLVEAQS
jgi:Topoisomerase 6 subunit A/Spo11, Toprim domain